MTGSDFVAYGTKTAQSRRILFFVTEDWFFVSHFLGLARAARDAGHVVGLATRLSKHRALLENEGFHIFALEGDRGALALREVWGELKAMNAAIRDFRPDILHLIAIRAIAFGGLLALARRSLSVVIAPTGLGYLFSSASRSARLGRSILRRLVAYYAWSGRARFVFENGEDPARFRLVARGPLVTIIGGAGVDQRDFPPQAPPPAGAVRFALVARMLRSKGIERAAEALRLARQCGHAIELHIFGDIDTANPTSLERTHLEELAREPGIVWHGHVQDVRSIWRDCHAAILLSEREGMPRALAEAAASARPIIASDVTGCREIVLHGVSGYLVALGDIEATASAMVRLAADADQRRRMGEASRAHFETRFTLRAVSTAMLRVYAELMHTHGKAAG